MDCLVRRDDDTIVYVNKMHKYKSDGNTPRPKINDKKNKKKIEKDNNELQQQQQEQEQDLIMILQMFL